MIKVLSTQDHAVIHVDDSSHKALRTVLPPGGQLMFKGNRSKSIKPRNVLSHTGMSLNTSLRAQLPNTLKGYTLHKKSPCIQESSKLSYLLWYLWFFQSRYILPTRRHCFNDKTTKRLVCVVKTEKWQLDTVHPFQLDHKLVKVNCILIFIFQVFPKFILHLLQFEYMYSSKIPNQISSVFGVNR